MLYKVCCWTINMVKKVGATQISSIFAKARCSSTCAARSTLVTICCGGPLPDLNSNLDSNLDSTARQAPWTLSISPWTFRKSSLRPSVASSSNLVLVLVSSHTPKWFSSNPSNADTLAVKLATSTAAPPFSIGYTLLESGLLLMRDFSSSSCCSSISKRRKKSSIVLTGINTCETPRRLASPSGTSREEWLSRSSAAGVVVVPPAPVEAVAALSAAFLAVPASSATSHDVSGVPCAFVAATSFTPVPVPRAVARASFARRCAGVDARTGADGWWWGVTRGFVSNGVDVGVPRCDAVTVLTWRFLTVLFDGVCVFADVLRFCLLPVSFCKIDDGAVLRHKLHGPSFFFPAHLECQGCLHWRHRPSVWVDIPLQTTHLFAIPHQTSSPFLTKQERRSAVWCLYWYHSVGSAQYKQGSRFKISVELLEFNSRCYFTAPKSKVLERVVRLVLMLESGGLVQGASKCSQ